ncbi:hypothetical protein [Piscinibacter koreensis]|uniref:DUF4124 domain-containing protein n=1 Tax=Piscinibacter koreensis TaxID=2742824 RepID=A0A7Y6NP68_9BURK|nr:hypothetical protein [Schlegelella koreensis]NUZ06731.1 hypothetical protein [Schlegelella koreensis]
MRWILALACCLLPCHSYAGSIYLCRAYSGGTFWSKAFCGQHNALVERIVSVPDSLPWEQQVQLAEQDAAQRARATRDGSTTYSGQTNGSAAAASAKQAECAALSAQAANYDSMARQAQTGQQQDWITREKRKITDAQYRLRC